MPRADTSSQRRSLRPPPLQPLLAVQQPLREALRKGLGTRLLVSDAGAACIPAGSQLLGTWAGLLVWLVPCWSLARCCWCDTLCSSMHVTVAACSQGAGAQPLHSFHKHTDSCTPAPQHKGFQVLTLPLGRTVSNIGTLQGRMVPQQSITAHAAGMRPARRRAPPATAASAVRPRSCCRAASAAASLLRCCWNRSSL